MLAAEMDATNLPSGEKTIENIKFGWCSDACVLLSVKPSHRLIVVVFEADASSLPSGEKATEENKSDGLSSV